MANGSANEFNVNMDGLSEDIKVKTEYTIKSRDENLKEMMDEKKEFDIFIIGGGANGTGVALDAASRGLKVAIIDAVDFAAATSSRSTKMAHGGIRYYENMMKLNGDPIESWHLLNETLDERNYFLWSAPYMNKPLPLLIPNDSFFWNAFWYFPGVWGYHLIYPK